MSAQEAAGTVLTAMRAGVAHITINRPDKRNALDRATIAALSAELRRCADDPAVRVVQITGAGEVFCAGADLGEMQAQAKAGQADNLKDAEQLAAMLALLDAIPKPTLARVNGDGYGGALGLLGACDIVVAADTAKFAFTEVRLGIIPAVISPFVLGKIGESAARRYFLTAEMLNATTLQDLGLVHEVVPADLLDPSCARITEALLKGAPKAQAEAKALIRDVAHGAAQNRAAASREAAARLARLRVQAEAQEGFSAFFAKRKASWRRD
jgi:methylglutaconyl-CoA hydratase